MFSIKKIQRILLFTIVCLLAGMLLTSCSKEYPKLLAVSTGIPAEITDTTATVYGNILSIGESGILDYGHVWGVSEYPTIGVNQTQLGAASHAGGFSSKITKLVPKTKYYVRAYATSGSETDYGVQETFTALPLSVYVRTNPVVIVSATSVMISGYASNLTGKTVSLCGFNWGTSSDPSPGTSNTVNASFSNGNFSTSIANLTVGTTYYVKARIQYFETGDPNNKITKYANVVSFVAGQAGLPTLTTNPISNISYNTATCGGNITSDGLAAITARGVCWSINVNPTIANSHTTNGTGIGSFSSSLIGLISGTTYYVRAYATNSAGTSYGNEISFTTTVQILSCGTVADLSGNTYNTVLIGSQCWMKENLKTTKYSNGGTIPNITDATTWMNRISGAYCDYDNTPSISVTYGKLYNWYAASNALNLCPTGWHVPTDADWTQLTDFLGGENVAGGKLKDASPAYWLSPNTNATNLYGFTALPAGGRSSVDGSFSTLSQYGFWWSSTITDYNTDYAYGRNVGYNKNSADRWGDSFTNGFSVRCLKN